MKVEICVCNICKEPMKESVVSIPPYVDICENCQSLILKNIESMIRESSCAYSYIMSRSLTKKTEYYRNSIAKEYFVDSQSRKQGEFKYYYSNGSIQGRWFYKDDKLAGEYTYYYRNGNIWCHCFYKENELDGEYTRYYEDGKETHSFYRNGVKIGGYDESV
jgi:antitoxin component YwqK of YwqJK toxin-antitoxin module